MISGFNIRLSDIKEARTALEKYLQPSPLLRNPWLSDEFHCDVYLKLENMQPIGSFKIRGATYRILQLSAAERRRGVIAASAGNHAQGVAWGSGRAGVKARIVMPVTAPLMKIQNTRALGAEVVLEGNSYSEAFQAAQRISRKSGQVLIHAFEDPYVIAGQGTVGLEILEQAPMVDYVLSSMGGGGLLSGVAIVMKEMRPKVKVVGCQAVGASALVDALKKKRDIRLPSVHTFADGIAVSQSSRQIRKILAPRLDRVLVADDEEIAAAVLTLIEKAKIVAEGAAAVPLAVLESMRKEVRGKKVVLIVSGGNIDVNVLGRIIDRGLIRAGRRVRINVLISDKPGSLNRLTDLIAREGANIIQAIHDRSEPFTKIDETEVALTLETRGLDHSQKIIAALRKHVLRLELIH